MGESYYLHLSQSPHVAGIVFCNLITRRLLFGRSNYELACVMVVWSAKLKSQQPIEICCVASSKELGLPFEILNVLSVKKYCKLFEAGIHSPYTGTVTSSSAASACYH